jgi:ABC-2 type transport system ATP-binding protein
MLELTGLGERRGEVVARLSGGNQQRINIAIGLLSRPSVLLLDEPSVGLDPRQRARLWEFVSALAGRGTSVIFSTHDIQEAERYGNRMLVLADGEALFDGPARSLREAVRTEAPEAADRDFETAFVAYLHHRGH